MGIVMSAASPSEARASQIRHRNETRIRVILPFVLVLLLLLGAMIAVFVLPRRLQVGIISDLMLSVLILCPAMLCLLPFTLLSVIAVFGMNRVHDAAARPLHRLEDASLRLAERTESTTERINQTTIGFSARFGALYKLLSFFESKEEQDRDE